MDQLRKDAREALQRDPWNLPDSLRAARAAAAQNDLHQLWLNVSTHDNSTNLNACESIYAALSFIKFGWDPPLPNDEGPRPLEGNEAQAVTDLLNWASALALPGSEFAVTFEEYAEADEGTKRAQEETRLRGSLAVTLILELTAKATLGLEDRESATDSPDVILAMASFTSEQDPWTIENSVIEASMHLEVALQRDKWTMIERVLKQKIRPLFTRAKNPAITSEGRKNLHPVPSSRFDGSVLDDSTKPWRNTDIYATSALSWIVSQCESADKAQLEAYFPLLVPAILSLIDDSSIHFKTKGCNLLNGLLKPIQKRGSDILLRTNLSSVFQDAIIPCLLSLPSITPEDSSLKILGASYPALLSLLKTAYKGPSKKHQSQIEEDKEIYITNLTKILRSNLISSFHHISSSTPAITTTSASFPYPRLSTFLLEWIAIFIKELGIHTTKYLQDIVPVLYTTLSNPFGTAHPPLLFAAVSATETLILNAHPRIWRWRGEVLGGLTACWLHLVGDSKETESGKRQASATELTKLMQELKSAVYVLKHALQNPFGVNGEPDADQLAAKDVMQKELQELVTADVELEGLLFADVTS